MISLYEQFCTTINGAKLLKDHYYGEEFLPIGMVILLGAIQFSRATCNKSFLLDDYGSYLVVRSTIIYVDRYVLVGVCHEDIRGKDCFHDLKGIDFWCPTKGLLPDFSDSCFSKGGHLGNMSQYVLTAPRKPRISMILHGGFAQGWRKCIFQLFEASWYQPVSKPIGFLDIPFKFEGVSRESLRHVSDML